MIDPRLPIVIGNWKQNTSRVEAEKLARQVAGQEVPGVQRAICPPAIWLATVREAVAGSDVAVGAQSSSAKSDGAFTGEISAGMIAELCSFVLVGHSERRQLFGETPEVVAAKVRLANDAGLGVVLCVGETAAERDRGDAETVVAAQVEHGLASIRDGESGVVVAYEPIWAIGTGRSASPDDASAMATSIARGLALLLPRSEIPVVYGGSVNAANAGLLMGGVHIRGFLVGGASLRADEFLAICRAARGAD